MRIGILANPNPVRIGPTVDHFLSLATKKGVEVMLAEDLNRIFNGKTYEFCNPEKLVVRSEILVALGGDGTILRAVTYIRDLNIPILGINTGRLGFLATISKDNIKQSVEEVLNDGYSIQERTLLNLETEPKSKEFSEINFALNEITIARKNTTSMIGLKTNLNGEYLTNYWADGLIIATPTGSTGYSLSCNGPVISPDSKNLVITPIAPHNLNARPMVISDNTTIQLEIESREKEFLISVDSRIASVPQNTKIKITKSTFTIKSIIPKNQSFLKTLRSKLLWGEDTRNENSI